MKQITANEFTSEVLEAQTPVLVDFFTEQCPPCRRIAPVIEEIEAASGSALKCVKIDASAELQLAAAFRITAVPTFLLFRNGTQLAQFTGERSRREIQRWIEEALR